MCVRVHFARPESQPGFDADKRVIRVPSGLPHVHTVTLVRAILRELIVDQPAFGAVCWCGEPVDLIPRIPHQRMTEQVVNHGA